MALTSDKLRGSVILAAVLIFLLQAASLLPDQIIVSSVVNATTLNSIGILVANDTTLRRRNDEPRRFDPQFPVVDILSVGSVSLPELQNAQHQTFGLHKAVRHFYKATEAIDTEKDCHTNLTRDHLQQISSFCLRSGKNWPPILRKLRSNFARIQWLVKKKAPEGWLCAQKRPIDGFQQLVSTRGYRNESNIPDFLFIADDDTYISMDNFVGFAPGKYPANEPWAVAGCMVRKRVHEHNFTFGFGGFGLVLNKMALTNFLKPLHCDGVTVDDPYGEADFVRLACWRLMQNGAGEKPLFREGMSVADLMHAYVFDQQYLNVNKWSPQSPGFCMHSDWVWGYFINYYHISNKPEHGEYFRDVLEDRLRGYNGSEFYTGKITARHRLQMKECWNSNDFRQLRKGASSGPYCPWPKAHLCHRIPPDDLFALHQKNVERNPQNFNLKPENV